MLNEMMTLRHSLQKLGVPTKPRHPDIQMLGKASPLLRVLLRDGGKVDSIEVIGKDVAPLHWTFRDGKHNSFPRISFKPALRGMATDDEMEAVNARRVSLAERRDAFLNLRDKRQLALKDTLPWLKQSHRERIQERGAGLKNAPDPRARQFARLAELFGQTDDEALLTQIDKLVACELTNNPSEDLLNLACRLCFFQSKKSSEDATKACDLYFDFIDPLTYSSSAHPGMVQILTESMSPPEFGTPNGICALTGSEAVIELGKFPEAKLGPLGPTFLHSRNDAIQSAHRYGASGPASMPVSRALASELQASAEELTSPQRKGKTWDSIPSEKPKQSDLLICFIAEFPDLELAEAMNVSEAGFEELGTRIAELAKGNSAFLPEQACVDFFMLRKIDDGNKKTILSSSMSVDAFQHATERWKQACGNVPDIELWVPGKRGEKALRIRPRTLTPGRIVGLSRKAYMTGGTKSQETSGLTFAESFGLVMRGGLADPASSRRILRFLLRRFEPLLLGIGHVRSRQIRSASKPDMESFSPECRRDALDVISLLGALLFHLNIYIHHPMNTPAYLLGQLLAGADVLHRGYCIDVRGQHLPPTLIGNAAMSTAAHSPAKALGQLQRRWKPYNGWAVKRRQDNFKIKIEEATSESDKARFRMIRDGAWAPVNLAPIAAALTESLDDQNPDDAFRAQLFLGYIAGLPRPEQG